MKNSSIESNYLLKLSKLENSLKYLNERVVAKTTQKNELRNYLFKIIKKIINEKSIFLDNIKIKSYLNCNAQTTSSCMYTLGFAGNLLNLDYIILAIIYIKIKKQVIRLMISKNYQAGKNQFINVREFFFYLEERFKIKINFSGGDEVNGYWLLLSE